MLPAGRFFGEDVILRGITSDARRWYSVSTLTFVHVHSLEAGSLDELLKNGDFPVMLKQIRSAASQVVSKVTLKI